MTKVNYGHCDNCPNYDYRRRCGSCDSFLCRSCLNAGDNCSNECCSVCEMSGQCDKCGINMCSYCDEPEYCCCDTNEHFLCCRCNEMTICDCCSNAYCTMVDNYKCSLGCGLIICEQCITVCNKCHINIACSTCASDKFKRGTCWECIAKENLRKTWRTIYSDAHTISDVTIKFNQ